MFNKRNGLDLTNTMLNLAQSSLMVNAMMINAKDLMSIVSTLRFRKKIANVAVLT